MTATRIGVRQDELEHELKVSRTFLSKERKKIPKNQWWKRGVTIFWSQEAAEEFRTKIRGKRAAKSARQPSTPEPLPVEPVAIVEPEPEPVAVIEEPAPPVAEEWNGLTLRAIKVCRNPSFVLCDIGGEKVAVKTKKGMSHKLPGKKIKVHVEMIDGQAHYTHQR